MLSIWDALCHKYILRTPENTLIQLHGNSFLVQLECPPDIDLSSPLYLGAKAPIDCGLKDKCCLMCELHELIYRPGAFKTEEHKQRRLQECLVALDAHLSGRSYREIAIKLWGQKRVLQNWQGGHGHLKELVRQRVRKGYYYMNGGYLDLLKI